MFVALDESIDDDHFVLAAAIAPQESTLVSIVEKFRKSIRKSPRTKTDKQQINNDPKEQLLYRSFPRYLSHYIQLIAYGEQKNSQKHRTDIQLIVACYEKSPHEKKDFKEDRWLLVYELLFLEIINQLVQAPIHAVDHPYHIVCDQCPKAAQMKRRLDEAITAKFPSLNYSLNFAHGHQCTSILVADIIAGTSRRHAGHIVPNEFHELKPLFLGGDIVRVQKK